MVSVKTITFFNLKRLCCLFMRISMKEPFMLRQARGKITVVIWWPGCREHHWGSVRLMKSFLTDWIEQTKPEKIEFKNLLATVEPVSERNSAHYWTHNVISLSNVAQHWFLADPHLSVKQIVTSVLPQSKHSRTEACGFVFRIFFEYVKTSKLCFLHLAQ